MTEDFKGTMAQIHRVHRISQKTSFWGKKKRYESTENWRYFSQNGNITTGNL